MAPQAVQPLFADNAGPTTTLQGSRRRSRRPFRVRAAVIQSATGRLALNRPPHVVSVSPSDIRHSRCR
jgi:hypothetical protein